MNGAPWRDVLTEGFARELTGKLRVVFAKAGAELDSSEECPVAFRKIEKELIWVTVDVPEFEVLGLWKIRCSVPPQNLK